MRYNIMYLCLELKREGVYWFTIISYGLTGPNYIFSPLVSKR